MARVAFRGSGSCGDHLYGVSCARAVLCRSGSWDHLYGVSCAQIAFRRSGSCGDHFYVATCARTVLHGVGCSRSSCETIYMASIARGSFYMASIVRGVCVRPFT